MRSALPSDQRVQDEEQGKKGKRRELVLLMTYDTTADCTAWLAVAFSVVVLDIAMYQDVFVAFSLVATIFFFLFI